jgi:hypothetical protein
MEQGYWDIVFDTLCANESALWALVGICGVIFLLLLVSLTVVSQDSATYVVVLIDMLSVAVVGLVSITVLRKCQPE